MCVQYIKLAVLICLFTLCFCSNGDRTPFFRNCLQSCERTNCTEDGVGFQDQAYRYYQQTFFDEMFLWICIDECQYRCMWKTTEAFDERGWGVPQFFGKWPFKRILGLQEPASVVFSILNLIAHVKLIKRFRREVASGSPCYKLWHVFAGVCINGWIWSTLFHARDLPVTEIMDYAFAYSIVLVMLYCMVMRMLYKRSMILRHLITVMFLLFYVDYFAYLSIGKFSYSLNMKTNVITGILSASGWLLWCFRSKGKRRYHYKIIRFYLLFGLAMSLELLDFPPIFWIFDAHSLWHLSTVPLSYVFYSFIIDDCKAMYLEKSDYEEGKKRI